jgi:hypothetical protein
MVEAAKGQQHRASGEGEGLMIFGSLFAGSIVAGTLIPGHLELGSLLPFIVALSFALGLNTYATVATLGLMARFHWIVLPAGLAPLHDTWVISAALALFACEFVADKIPFLDLFWNVAHTFIRVPVAALLAWRASAPLSAGQQALVVAISAAVALAAHTGKTAARTLVTPSPEPVSNIVLSSAEDAAAIGLTWAATQHPWSAAVLVLLTLVVLAIFARWVVRGLRRQRTHLRQRLGRLGHASHPARL